MPTSATTLLASLLLFRPFRKLAQRWYWLLALVTTAAAGQGWQPGFHCPGLNNYVTTVVTLPNGDLIAGGSFTNAGGHPAADYLARWDGRAWQALGTGLSGINNGITALVAAPDGTVFAAGTRIDSSGVYGLVARWNGLRWQQLGPATRGSWILTLAVAANGDLLAGTNNAAVGCGVLRWQGQAWQPLAPTAPAGGAVAPPASTITQLVTTPTGDILAVGRFATTSNSCTEVARWTGAAWQPLRATDPNVCGIASLAVAANGDLLGCATWYKHDGASHYRYYAARWNGHDWQQLGADLPSGATRLLTAAAGRVVVNCVAYPDYGTSRATTLAYWDGARWHLQYLGKENISANREALALDANGDVIVRDPIYSLTRWDGRQWHALADEQSVGFPGTYHAGRITALAVAPNHDVLLAGLFYPDTPDTLAPHLAHLQVCRWDGRRRHYLGTGLSGDISTVTVAANGEVLIGGQFKIKVPGAPDSLCHVAHWDGHRWQHLGTNLPFTVNALAVAPNGDVLAGGREGLARWDGHQWQPLPLPFPGASALNQIQAVAITPTGGLVVGGSFSPTFGSVEASVLRWEGGSWQVVARTPHTFVQSLALGRQGQLVVGTGSTSMVHSFSQSSGSVFSMQANGNVLQSQPFDNYVQTVAVAPNGDIIAGGGFTDYLVRWDGKTWQRIGSGLKGAVWAVAVAPNGDIIAGGDFTTTGDGAQSLSLWGIYRTK